ncbi:MAG: hypothetical protein RLZZ37_399 [Actinomycetota bacterium]
MIYLDAEIQQRRKAFGKSMKKVRIQAKLSQERLAEIAGLDRKTISRIENGHLSPSLDNLWAIADALEMQAYELLLPMARKDFK